MKSWWVGGLVVAGTLLSGCTALCLPDCARQSHFASSSSLVAFLYPHGEPPRGDAIPELHVPLRVGLAFLPTRSGVSTLDEAHKEQLLEQIRARFASRKFISQIVIIPDYYLADRGLADRGLAGRSGFEGLEGVQRLYGVDLMALVSYDQVTHVDDSNWSLGYLTIVGAAILKGTRHDESTLIDLAVVDAPSRSLVLRAGGTDTRHGTATLIQQDRESREAGVAGFTAATTQMIEHFDSALTQLEADVRAGKANVRIVSRNAAVRTISNGGGGAFTWGWLLALLPLAAVRRRTARDAQ